MERFVHAGLQIDDDGFRGHIVAGVRKPHRDPGFLMPNTCRATPSLSSPPHMTSRTVPTLVPFGSSSFGVMDAVLRARVGFVQHEAVARVAPGRTRAFRNCGRAPVENPLRIRRLTLAGAQDFQRVLFPQFRICNEKRRHEARAGGVLRESGRKWAATAGPVDPSARIGIVSANRNPWSTSPSTGLARCAASPWPESLGLFALPRCC